jgi:hypothetical protein
VGVVLLVAGVFAPVLVRERRVRAEDPALTPQ